MDYLRVLDNFRQDIPLVAVLKSPFGRMTNRGTGTDQRIECRSTIYQNVLETADPEKKTDLPAGILKKSARCIWMALLFPGEDTVHGNP